jgi:hypothetical protein
MNSEQKRLLAAMYDAQPIVLDRLHHTMEFNVFCNKFNSFQTAGFSQHDIYEALIRMRKKGELPRKTERKVRENRTKGKPAILQQTKLPFGKKAQ